MADPIKSPLRVVIDVNLLVRSVLAPTGGSALLIQKFKQGVFLSITCRKQLHELYRVLGYPRLLRRHRITRRQRQRITTQLYKRSVWVEPRGQLAVCRDPNDDYLIEIALLGRATCLVSEDNDFHSDSEIVEFLNRRGIHLLHLSEFLAILQDR
jgi:putative PIN family toxin of toxin-antitoxin system